MIQILSSPVSMTLTGNLPTFLPCTELCNAHDERIYAYKLAQAYPYMGLRSTQGFLCEDLSACAQRPSRRPRLRAPSTSCVQFPTVALR